MEQTKTFDQLCTERQMKVGSVAKTYFTRRGLSFDKYAIPTETQYAEIFEGQKTRTRTATKTVNVPETVSIRPQIFEIVPGEIKERDTKTGTEPKTKTKKRDIWRILGLLFLMLAPVFGSFQNVNTVTGNLLDTKTASLTFTVLFSLAPFVIAWVGVGALVRYFVVPVLMLFEGFCNLTRIYAGLVNFDQNAFPNRFLQLVCDIFNSGTKGTALAISAIMAALSLVIFFAGYIGLNKK